ncbi:MAG TPA: hypothetical protein PKY59_17330 [Pyrinomonadaceae bacterium]|nr:hypothetical protein [Pyrinomonadaceae bacterium]
MPINYQKTFNNLSYEEKLEFSGLTIKTVKEIYPHYKVEPVEPHNAEAIYITNQDDNVRIQFPLYDLYNRFLQTSKTRNDLKEVILRDFSQLISQIEDSESFINEPEFGFIDVKHLIQPRLCRIEDLPNEVDDYVHLPFGEGIVTTFSIFHEKTLINTRIKKEMLAEWEISFDDLYKLAMDNFAHHTDGMPLVGTAQPHGYLRNENGDEYSASALLIGGIRYLIAQTIGTPFRFGIPSSHLFYCWCELEDAEFQIEMRAMMQREFERLPGKLSTNIYEVDEKGQIKQLKDLPELPKPSQKISNN